MSGQRGRKQIVLCAYFTDEEPEAREMGGDLPTVTEPIRVEQDWG